ncbi:hypothetical protein L7F22_034856 [Adiantum nelumboides]|nr:hypothetical protein [Adiantum nelumboides]
MESKHGHIVHSFDKESKPLELVHGDLCRPMPSKFYGDTSYYVTFIDDATQHVWVYAMKSKDETFSCFKYLSSSKTQSEHKLKALRLDNGGEYVSKEFADFCSSRGIKREFIAPYTPAQNGVAKQMNRTIQERIMSMLS